jgi:methyl-accepting chemotaxis protein
MDEILMISPGGEFQNLYLGNIILRSRGLHILVIGWWFGASDIGEIEFTLYSSGISREQVVDVVNNITSYNISNIISELRALSSRLSNLENNITLHYTTLQGIYSDLLLTNLSIQNLSISLDEVSKRIGLIDQMLNSINRDLPLLKDQISKMSLQIQDLYNKYSDAYRVLERHNTSINNLGSQLASLSTEYKENRIFYDERLNNIEKILSMIQMILVATLVLSVGALALSVVSMRRR